MAIGLLKHSKNQKETVLVWKKLLIYGFKIAYQEKQKSYYSWIHVTQAVGVIEWKTSKKKT